MKGHVAYIKSITFAYNIHYFVLGKFTLLYPFDGCDLSLNSTSVIISTMCKNYGLDEWISWFNIYI